MEKNDFLPVSKEDMQKRGWDYYDFLYIIGDAYVDHPSFGHAIISRLLESRGYRVAICAQPDWHSAEPLKKFGKPRLGVLVTAGNIDSMVNHYTVNKKRRHDDAYSPENKAGHRPDRATIVYCNRAREAFGKIPILIGGVEASLRRFAHYDYWDDKVRRSILIDSGADILMYGMGERQITELADMLNMGIEVENMITVPGTCFISSSADGYKEIPSFEECVSDKRAYAISCREQYLEQNPYTGEALAQKHGDRYLIQNPPQPPLQTYELDEVAQLPYMRNYHPMYKASGGIKAIEEVKFSLSMNRGCYGSCSFCALAFHQGRIVTSRSDESIIKEAKLMIKDPDFKGYIHDVGGPTANFRDLACAKQSEYGACRDKRCLWPQPCKNMRIDHTRYLKLLRKLRALPGVKKVFIRSGIRFDYLMADKDDTFFRELIKYHTSGQLRVAPEHVSDNVLRYMGKPPRRVYDSFMDKFYKLNDEMRLNQYAVPYLMSSHPGSTMKDAIKLAEYLNEHRINPEQVQDFYPTPGTISTCMYYTGLDPFTMKPVYVPRSKKEKEAQRALLQFTKPENYETVRRALVECGREDLIGFAPRCLIKPFKEDFNKDKKVYKGKGDKHGNASEGKRSFSKNKGRNEGRGKKTSGARNKSGAGGNTGRRGSGKSGIRKK
ncbi:MAG: YgiQ family radical SAM protein [Clostridiales bacterium]|nr:YgiQ family radical SAM protein [Clostridiales bacterium]